MKSAQTGGTASSRPDEDSKSCKTGFEKKAGRPRKLSGQTAQEIREYYLNNPCSVRELAGIFGISRSTVWRAVAGG
ncbi:helix-turn-helix domain-containing protein [Candidatus Micrarchaeota archaeon]|nr:helix-turn-helix domain-containing protein [Candidatus Micrarchaeota archaeon]